MPLKYNQTKCNAVKFNNTTLSVIKYNGNNVFKSGNVVFKYTLTSRNAGLNGYAPQYYVKIKNRRTGVEKTVGGAMGLTQVSLPALDGDIIDMWAYGYYEGGSLSPVSPLQTGIDDSGAAHFTYPLNDTDIVFDASLYINGYYNGEFQRWEAYQANSGTVTANYYVKID